MSLTGKTKAGSYKDLLQMNNSNSGIDASSRKVVDGEGTESAISISDDHLNVRPVTHNHHSTFTVADKDNNLLFKTETNNMLVKAGSGQHTVNTQIQQFGFNSYQARPTTTDTWTALDVNGNAGRKTAYLEMGTGSTPATTLTIATTADDVVGCYFYVPVNITIDSCNVWFGQSAATGDTVKFSVMSYDVDTDNGSTGGDLTSGTENCVSPSTINAGGYEQAYFQNLTISANNVDAGKVIMACVHQGSTNSDLSVNMQLVYHLR